MLYKARRLYKLTGVGSSFLDITNSCTFNHVPHGETLDGLVFRDTSRAVGASNKVDMAAAILVAATISSLLSLHVRSSTIDFTSVRE